MDISSTIAGELGIRKHQADAVIDLIDAGCTIPFIARYRKEATGALSDDVLRRFDERLKYLRKLEDRKAVVIASIEEQGKMDDRLRGQIEKAETAVAVEDIYRPYRPKRRTRAVIAEEKGLRGLADYILSPGASEPAEKKAADYVCEEKGVPDADAAVQGALDIIAGEAADSAGIRAWVRRKTEKEGAVTCCASQSSRKEVADGGDAASTYENYFDFSEPVRSIPGHRILAINRGEKEKALTVKVEAPEDEIVDHITGRMCSGRSRIMFGLIGEACADSYRRLIAPSIETEIRNSLTEKAEDGAIAVFGKNLEQLLMQPPMKGKTVLGWDPAFRTGCKLAVIDPTGKILETAVIFPTAPQKKVEESENVLARLIGKYGVDVISLGNGTASRESERIIVDFFHKYEEGKFDGIPGCRRHRKLSYVIVNEAGASVYSASRLATEEYPDLDVGERSSASIARRLQDPLSELVKIDPKAIGVGQYQHDMDQKKLGSALTAVVEDCVNRVGVDLNTASPSLLGYVSGITKQTASNIVRYREKNGSFRSRRDLLKVDRLGEKAFEQCAGFLRISGGTEPLDMTAVHPESYETARKLLKMLGFTEDDLKSGEAVGISSRIKLMEKNMPFSEIASSVSAGEYTLKDIIDELERPGRDPREAADAPILRSDVLEISDLREGMKLKGTVRNVVDFGAFVDIGVHQDGLVHVSEMADRFVKHPLDVVSVGQIVDVTVLGVDEKRGRISLSMKR
jgi:uncharacterized protein